MSSDPANAQLADARAWAASGAAALTGRVDGPPLGPPARLMAGLQHLGSRLRELSGAAAIDALDVPALLGERAAITGLTRRGAVSCGGATRMVPTRDGSIAVSLGRDDDVACIPAWLELDALDEDPWATVERHVRWRPTRVLVERARLLGLPVAPVGSPAAPVPSRCVVATQVGMAGPRAVDDSLLVVDLSSLWAGPLCGNLLARLGARVVKVESRARPDGARRGPPAFFDLLNSGKESVALDFRSAEDVADLRQLLARADVVIEASRPRALEQLGIRAVDLIADGPAVWVSITGYGRGEAVRDWTAFGDDAAAAGGLVVTDQAGVCFCADAIADPLTGLEATVAALTALRDGQRVLLDVPMERVAAKHSGASIPLPAGMAVSAPRARSVRYAAASLGEHTDAVLGRR